MAVEGLTGFIESNPAFLRGRNFSGSRLIVDGSSLYVYLYVKSQLDQKHGGDYDAFEDIVKLFFKSLDLCGIVPYLVLDGEKDLSDRSRNQTEKTLTEKIKMAVSLTRGQTGEMLPILIENVFMQILYEIKVPFIQCHTGAVREMAALANEWNCPILSNNSDFYIFLIQGGVLPISHFQWRNVNHLKPGTSTRPHIPTKCYGYLNLCTFYNHMRKNLLPLFATILGSTNLCRLDKNTLPTWTEFSTVPGKYAEMDGFLKWLSRFTGQRKAIATLLNRTKPNESICKKLHYEMKKYRLGSSSIERFFICTEVPSTYPVSLRNVPNWILMNFIQGKLSSSIMDVLRFGRVEVSVQVEDFTLSSSGEVSWSLRQVTYGILRCSRGEKPNPNDVEEYDRLGTTLAYFTVPAVVPRCSVSKLHLETLWETPHSLRLQLLFEALCVSPLPKFLHLPQNLQLVVYVTCFWIKHAEPEPRAEAVWALLIVLVYGQMYREHETDTEIWRLEALCSRKGKKMLCPELAHTFSQWQRCLKDAYDLNKLLNNPVPEPELSRLYCGSLVHCVARELMRGVEPESLLSGTSRAVEMYRVLQAAVERNLDVEQVERLRLRRGPSRPRGPREDDRSEYDDDDEEEEDEDKKDEIYEVNCGVQSRDLKRSRALNPRSKKHERVRWQ